MTVFQDMRNDLVLFFSDNEKRKRASGSDCRHAFALDYQVTLVKDGHSTYDTELLPARDVIAHHNALLTAFATVVEADAIDFSSKRSVGT